jgi:hypothetical protein
MNVVLLYECFDRRVPDDDEFSPVTGARLLRSLGECDQAFGDAVTAGRYKGADNDLALFFWCEATDQVRVKFGEDKVGQCVQQPHRQLCIAWHSDTSETALSTRPVNLDTAEYADAVTKPPFDLVRVAKSGGSA